MLLNNRKKNYSKIAFAVVATLFISIELLYLFNIVRWADYPDFGFGFRTATGTDVVGFVREHAQEAGMQVGDRILRVNDKSFTTREEIRNAQKWNPGEKNVYIVERDGRRFQVTITNIRKGFKQVFIRSGLLYLLGFCYTLIGTIIFLMKPHHRTSWIFFVVVGTFGLYISFLYKAGRITPHWLETFHIFAHTFTPAALIHLALSFPQERILLKKHPYTQILPYIASGILFLRIRSVAPNIMDAPKTMLIAAMTYLVISVLLFLGSCLQLLVKSPSEIVKRRSKVILIGIAISFSLPLIDFAYSILFRRISCPILTSIFLSSSFFHFL